MMERINKGHHVEILLEGGPFDGCRIFVSPMELGEEIRYAWTEDGELCTVLKEAFYKVTGAFVSKDDANWSGPRMLKGEYVTTLHHSLGLTPTPEAAQ